MSSTTNPYLPSGLASAPLWYAFGANSPNLYTGTAGASSTTNASSTTSGASSTTSSSTTTTPSTTTTATTSSTSSTGSVTPFITVPLTTLITLGIAVPVFGRTSGNLSGWRIVTPMAGVSVDQTSNLYWATGDCMLPLNPADTSFGTTINATNSLSMSPSSFLVLMVNVSGSYGLPINASSWSFAFDNTGSVITTSTSAGSKAFGAQMAFWYVPTHTVLSSGGQTYTVLGGMMTATQGVSTFSTTTDATSRVIAAVNQTMVISLTPSFPASGVTQSQYNLALLGANGSNALDAVPASFLPPYEFASNFSQHVGASGAPAVVPGAQVNNAVAMGANPCWSVARASPYSHFWVYGGGSNMFQSADQLFTFNDVAGSSTLAICCLQSAIASGATVSSAGVSTSSGTGSGSTGTASGTSSTTTGSSGSTSTTTTGTSSTSTTALTLPNGTVLPPNCGAFSAAAATGIAQSQTVCGKYVSSIGASIFTDPNWQPYLSASTSYGQFDGLFEQALQSYGQSSQTTSTLPIFSCSVPPVYSTLIPAATQSVINQNLPCLNPSCLTSGYRIASLASPNCVINIQNCLQNANVQIASLSQVNTTVQLQALLNCTQTTSASGSSAALTSNTSSSTSVGNSTTTTGSGTSSGTTSSTTTPLTTTSGGTTTSSGTTTTPTTTTTTPSTASTTTTPSTTTTTPVTSTGTISSTSTTSSTSSSSHTLEYVIIIILAFLLIILIVALARK